MDKVVSVTLEGKIVTVGHEDAEPSIQRFSQPEHAAEYAKDKADVHGVEVTVVERNPVAEDQVAPVAEGQAD